MSEVNEAISRAKESKKLRKLVEDLDTRSTDALFVVPKSEVDVLEDVLLSALTGEPLELDTKSKVLLLNVLKVIQS